MPTYEEVARIMARVIRCSEQEIKSETVLADLKADSLHWLQIIVGVETSFDIEIDIEKMVDMKTMEDFVSYIDSLRT
jgi:acyl carrier protein